MRMKQVGNKADVLAVVIRNADTATIPLGTPVILVLNGTNDGLDVVLPSTAGASKMHSLAYGVTIGPAITANSYGEAMIFGFHSNVVLTRQTRSASTVTWASEASIASFVLMNIESVANGFQIGATLASTNFLPFAVLAQSLASYASSATATTDSRTALTAAVKAFLRII